MVHIVCVAYVLVVCHVSRRLLSVYFCWLLI